MPLYTGKTTIDGGTLILSFNDMSAPVDIVDGASPLLVTLENNGVSLPYGCRYGGCISCAAKLLAGEVDQSGGVALNGRQMRDGYVLLCVARPQSDCTLDVGVESHDKLYRNPFQSPLRPDELKADIRADPKPMEDSR